MPTMTQSRTSMSSEGVLAWAKAALVEMVGCRIDPMFLAMSSRITRPMFEYLRETALLEHKPLAKNELEWVPAGEQDPEHMVFSEFVSQFALR